MSEYTSKFILKGIDAFSPAIESAKSAINSTKGSIADLNKQLKNAKGIRDLDEQIKKNNQTLASNTQRLKEISQEYKNSGKNAGLLKSEYNSLLRQNQKLTNVTEDQKIALSRLRRELDAAGVSYDKLDDHIKDTHQTIKKFEKDLDRQTSSYRELTAVQKEQRYRGREFDRTLQRTANVYLAARGVASVGRGMASTAMGMLQPSIDFDAQIAALAAKADITKAGYELQRLKKQALDIGNGQLGYNQMEVVQGQTSLALAGVKPNEISDNVVKKLLFFSKASGLNVDASSAAVTAIAAQFKEPIENIGRVGDVLAYTGAASLTSVDELTQAYKYLGPAAKQVGMSLELSAGSLALLAKYGVTDTTAGTGMRYLMLRLADRKIQRYLESKGAKVLTDDKKGFLPWHTIFKNIGEAASKMTGPKATQFLKRIGEDQGFVPLNILANAYKNKDDMALMMDLVMNRSKWEGYSKRMNDTIMDNAQASAKKFSDSLDNLTAKLGDKVLPALTNITNAAAQAVTREGEYTNEAKKYLSAGLVTTVVTAVAAFFSLPQIASLLAGAGVVSWAKKKELQEDSFIQMHHRMNSALKNWLWTNSVTETFKGSARYYSNLSGWVGKSMLKPAYDALGVFDDIPKAVESDFDRWMKTGVTPARERPLQVGMSQAAAPSSQKTDINAPIVINNYGNNNSEDIAKKVIKALEDKVQQQKSKRP